MSTGTAARSAGGGRHRSGLAIGTLLLGAFVVGSAERDGVGVLNEVARDMEVPIGAAGTQVTAQ